MALLKLAELTIKTTLLQVNMEGVLTLTVRRDCQSVATVGLRVTNS